jgi:hypothetical protein
MVAKYRGFVGGGKITEGVAPFELLTECGLPRFFLSIGNLKAIQLSRIPKLRPDRGGKLIAGGEQSEPPAISDRPFGTRKFTKRISVLLGNHIL